MMTEVTCAVIVRDGKVLATQRSERMPHPLKWEFPGGKIKVGESPEQCIKREIIEELGIKIKVVQLFPTVIHSYEKSSIKLIPFLCSMMDEKISLREHKHYEWVFLSDLNTIDWLEADRKIVEKLQLMNSISF